MPASNISNSLGSSLPRTNGLGGAQRRSVVLRQFPDDRRDAMPHLPFYFATRRGSIQGGKSTEPQGAGGDVAVRTSRASESAAADDATSSGTSLRQLVDDFFYGKPTALAAPAHGVAPITSSSTANGTTNAGDVQETRVLEESPIASRNMLRVQGSRSPGRVLLQGTERVSRDLPDPSLSKPAGVIGSTAGPEGWQGSTSDIASAAVAMFAVGLALLSVVDHQPMALGAAVVAAGVGLALKKASEPSSTSLESTQASASLDTPVESVTAESNQSKTPDAPVESVTAQSNQSNTPDAPLESVTAQSNQSNTLPTVDNNSNSSSSQALESSSKPMAPTESPDSVDPVESKRSWGGLKEKVAEAADAAGEKLADGDEGVTSTMEAQGDGEGIEVGKETSTVLPSTPPSTAYSEDSAPSDTVKSSTVVSVTKEVTRVGTSVLSPQITRSIEDLGQSKRVVTTVRSAPQDEAKDDKTKSKPDNTIKAKTKPDMSPKTVPTADMQPAGGSSNGAPLQPEIEAVKERPSQGGDWVKWALVAAGAALLLMLLSIVFFLYRGAATNSPVVAGLKFGILVDMALVLVLSKIRRN